MNQDNPNGFVESERGIILNAPLPEERQPPTTPVSKPPKKHEGKIVGLILFVLAAGLIAFAATQIDYTAISDTIAGSGYEADEDLSKIIDDIGFTNDGMRILKATRPALQSADEFNQHCESHSQGSSILGCYRDGHIYIYNIQHSKLEGIRQATLAHEFLHAVWSRMSSSEQEELKASLTDVYNSSAELQKDMEIYDVSDPSDEIHSRVGTQIMPDQLPDVLRVHYAKYFNDQASVVTHYKKYSIILDDAKKEIEALKVSINEHRKKLSVMSEKYDNDYKSFNADLNDYNKRRNTPNGFETEEEYRAAYESLVSRQKQLQADYTVLIKYLEETNNLINEQNRKALYANDLQHSIDSNFKETKEGV